MYHPPQPQQTYVLPPQQYYVAQDGSGYVATPSVVVIQQQAPVYIPPQVQQQSTSAFLHIVKAVYGKGNRAVDVTAILQKLVMNKGGWALSEFGYWFTPTGKMNEMFGDPCPGVDKELHITYEMLGNVKEVTVGEDHKISIDLEADYKRAHSNTTTTLRIPINLLPHNAFVNPHVDVASLLDTTPDMVKQFNLEVVSATYGVDGHFNDVTAKVATMAKKNSGKRLNEFGCGSRVMNAAFGDPYFGRRKCLTVEYRWRTPRLTISVGEDKQVNIDFGSLQQFI